MNMKNVGDFSIVHVDGTQYFFNAPKDDESHPISELLTYGSWAFLATNGISVSVDMSLNPIQFNAVSGVVDLLGSDIACFTVVGVDGEVEFETFDDLFDGFDEVYP